MELKRKEKKQQPGIGSTFPELSQDLVPQILLALAALWLHLCRTHEQCRRQEAPAALKPQHVAPASAADTSDVHGEPEEAGQRYHAGAGAVRG